ncbi:CheR family methyltransferase [Plantactinospora siamensis]|uniref:CheR family methyltransferase n=1 Tax=Plantactinospora siamensis TaxID=555372 RepID=UPI00366FFB92
MSQESDPRFESLLDFLKESRGFDFTGYKRASLMRRVRRRMAQLEIDDFAEYQDHLEVHPDEFTSLFNNILINVTGFFREPESWQFLAETVLPEVLAAKAPGSPIRIWSAGCASGEEAYTIAMLLAEALGDDQFKDRVKIYATDVDEESLAEARLATYGERQVADVPPELLERYFDRTNGRFSFRKDLRRLVIFGRNDLVQDAPISRVDLLVCRNTLMYFNSETQTRVLSRLHFALSDRGVLFLGRSEMLLRYGDLFIPIDIKRRIFRKLAVPSPSRASVVEPPAPSLPADPDPVGLDRLRDEAFQASPLPTIVLTTTGLVAYANRRAETLLGVSVTDIGRPFRDLELSYRPVELRGYVEQAQVERRIVEVPETEYPRDDTERRHVKIQAIPLVSAESRLLGVALAFRETTAERRLRDDLSDANHRLEVAYEELQTTSEELETTNEELQSSVEELETTNEELQSTNEELETMNEELQSTNEELRNINDEHRERAARLDQANSFLDAVLTSLHAGVLAIDANMVVQAWNRRAEDLWGLRADEAVGEHVLNLDIGLPTAPLRTPLRAVLSGDETGRQSVALDAVNRRGRPIRVRVTSTPLLNVLDGTTGALLVMEAEGDEPGNGG